eukprot:1162018-Pelagomonas_calceolata.AAC.12
MDCVQIDCAQTNCRRLPVASRLCTNEVDKFVRYDQQNKQLSWNPPYMSWHSPTRQQTHVFKAVADFFMSAAVKRMEDQLNDPLELK